MCVALHYVYLVLYRHISVSSLYINEYFRREELKFSLFFFLVFFNYHIVPSLLVTFTHNSNARAGFIGFVYCVKYTQPHLNINIAGFPTVNTARNSGTSRHNNMFEIKFKLKKLTSWGANSQISYYLHAHSEVLLLRVLLFWIMAQVVNTVLKILLFSLQTSSAVFCVISNHETPRLPKPREISLLSKS
jgi:hypothetical protein